MYLYPREHQPPLHSRLHDACHPSVGSLGSIAGRAGRSLSAYGNSLIPPSATASRPTASPLAPLHRVSGAQSSKQATSRVSVATCAKRLDSEEDRLGLDDAASPRSGGAILGSSCLATGPSLGALLRIFGVGLLLDVGRALATTPPNP